MDEIFIASRNQVGTLPRHVAGLKDGDVHGVDGSRSKWLIAVAHRWLVARGIHEHRRCLDERFSPVPLPMSARVAV
jgi:hypothetical protein